MQSLLAEILRRLDYDPEKGELRRKSGFDGVTAGKPLGCPASNGGLQCEFLGRRRQVSHLIWLIEKGELPQRKIRHINGNKTDCRIENLTELIPLVEQRHVSHCELHGEIEISLHRRESKGLTCPQCGIEEGKRKSGQHIRAVSKARRKSPEEKKATAKAYKVIREARAQVAPRCPNHPKRPIHANGLCSSCCARAHTDALSDEDRAHRKARQLAYKRANKERLREQAREYYASPQGKAVSTANKRRRRARIQGHDIPSEGPHWSVIGPRDGWICHLCQQGIPLHLRDSVSAIREALAPTVDHIIPISAGGPDTYDNVKLAHRSCNSARWNRPVEEFNNSKGTVETWARPSVF